MVNLAIYVRVSTNKQTYSRQIEDIKQYIKSIYKDESYSIDVYAEKTSGFRSSKDRPELTKFLDKVEATPTFYQCLFVTELSRVGRNPIHARIVVTELLEQGIDVCVTSSNGGQNFLNKDGSIDKTKFAVLGLLMDFAQIEIDQFKSRTASGLKEKIMNGGVTGGLLQPFGYRKSEDKKIVIDEDEAEVIKYIFDQYKEGNGMGSIAKKLNERGVLTRTNKAFEGRQYKGKDADSIKWTANQINVILNNTIYCGQRIFKKRKENKKIGSIGDNSEKFESPNTIIISKDLFDQCTEIRLEKKGNGRNIHTKNVILLQYKMKCGVCGRNYTHRVFDEVQNYICSSRVVNGVETCSNFGVNIDLVDSAIYDILCQSESVLKYLNDTDSIRKEILNKISLLEDSLPLLERELVSSEKRIGRLLDLHLDDDISVLGELQYNQRAERFKQKNAALESVNTNLRNQIAIQSHQLTSNKRSLEGLKEIRLDNTLLKQAKYDRNKLKAIYNQIINSVTITKINFQFIRLDITLQISGQELDGTLRVVVSRKGLRKKPYKYQYNQEYIPRFNPAEEDEDDYFYRLHDLKQYDYSNSTHCNEIISNFVTITDNVLIMRPRENNIKFP